MDEINGEPGGIPDDAVPADSVPGDASPQGPDQRGSERAIVAFAAIALMVLLVGLIVWAANRGGDDVASVTIAPSSTVADTLPADTTTTTTPPTATSTTTTTTPPTTTSTTTTSTPATTTTSSPATTTTTTFALPEPGSPTWTVALDIGRDITLELATTDGDVSVYDGVVDALRCVGVVGPGKALTSWCGERDVATTFIADRGLEPLTIEMKAETGSVVVQRQATGWTLASNGCSTPMVTILGAAEPRSHAITSVICAGEESFMGFGTTLFGPELRPDGGGVLLADGDEGWNVIDIGTSIACDDQLDGVDRCQLFGVQFELFEALLPVPTTDALGLTAIDVVDVADRSAEVSGWIGDANEPDEIEAILTDQLVDPTAEVPASVRRAGPFGRLHLVIVEIPQLDDSFRFETWAVWIRSGDDGPDVRAYSWGTCGRGVTGDGLCV